MMNKNKYIRACVGNALVRDSRDAKGLGTDALAVEGEFKGRGCVSYDLV